MMLDRMSHDDVETWKQDPCTQALLADLRAMAAQSSQLLSGKAANGAEAPLLNALGGRCTQLGEVIAMIEQARGTLSE